MKVISFINHKGGLGKSTSAINTAYALKDKGHRVLAVDLDAQSNLTLAMGLGKSLKSHVGKFIEGEVEFADAIHNIDGLTILPASIHTTKSEKTLGNQEIWAHELKEKLEELNEYDFCIIDCPPSLGTFVYMAMVASDFVFIPMQPEFFAYEGLENIIDAFNKVKKHYNPKLQIGGIFLTKFNPAKRNSMHSQVVDAIKESYPNLMMESYIRDNSKLSQAQTINQSIYEFEPASNGAKDYLKFTEELLERIK